MDDDIWMLYGKKQGAKIDTTATRILSIKETSLPFIFCFSGLMIAFLTFLTELCGMYLYSGMCISHHSWQFQIHIYSC